MASQELGGELHFLFVPLMSQSHLIPFIDMAKQLASRGPNVTILLTPLNALRFRSITDQTLIDPNLKIQFLILQFPCREAGLPDGCENMDSLPSPDFVSNFFDASNLLQGPLEDWLEGARPRPDCLVSDICLPWTADLGLRFNIPRIVFHGISCFTMFCSHNLKKSRIKEKVKSDSEPFRVPNMPDEIVFTKAQLPEMQLKNSGPDDMENLLYKFKAAELSADGVMVNTFEELEPNYVKGYQSVVKRLWCIGPVSLSNTKNSSKIDRGNKSAIDESLCLEWLDSRNPSSVLYICFGSLCHVSASQLIELALGLESSNRSFMWVIKKGDYSEELENWFAEEKYEERVKDRGIIIRGWAPQVLILSHSAVGGFMTHCGWNSTLEGVSAGVPMITWPMFAEQFYNEKLIVQVIGTGVRVGVERCMNWGEEDKVGVLVRREDVRRAIEKLMDEGKESDERRRRARKLGEVAERAVEGGGSSYSNMNLMIQHVKELLNRRMNEQYYC
ncbi:UDP-glycosyltransferase 73C3-like [Punica granatum]|uniref:Glycosyltransferase n=1 Tax=Punica granatum TaxID=22663 RepID=A0A218XCQ3_PUNGR|nr:UDP-glycosyltransferase 73C3-like [Punica granatum]OWM82459.1 hypothetical protein CDL15_Pgr002033 [Punica granatum]